MSGKFFFKKLAPNLNLSGKFELGRWNGYLTIKERRIVVDVGDFDGERADTFQRRFTLISGFDRHRDELAVVAFSVEDFVGEDLARLFVDGELGAFLVGLLDDRVLDLTVDAFVGVGGLDAGHGAAVRGALFDFGTVTGTVVEHGLVVVDISDEDDHDSRRCVTRSAAAAASAVVDGRYVQLVLVPVFNS